MSKDNMRKIFYFIGMIGIFVAGLTYVMLCDMLIKTNSTWLFVSIIFSLGSGICCIFADVYKEKRKAEIVLKSVSIGLAALFIGFLIFFRFGPLSVFPKNRDKGLSLIIVVISLVITLASLVGQIGDLVLTVTNKDDVVDEEAVVGHMEEDQSDDSDAASDDSAATASATNADAAPASANAPDNK